MCCVVVSCVLCLTACAWSGLLDFSLQDLRLNGRVDVLKKASLRLASPRAVAATATPYEGRSSTRSPSASRLKYRTEHGGNPPSPLRSPSLCLPPSAFAFVAEHSCPVVFEEETISSPGPPPGPPSGPPQALLPSSKSPRSEGEGPSPHGSAPKGKHGKSER